jgi:hypothetical protein
MLLWLGLQQPIKRVQNNQSQSIEDAFIAYKGLQQLKLMPHFLIMGATSRRA